MPDLLDTQRRFFKAVRNRQEEAVLLDLLAGEPEFNASVIAIYRGNAVANTLGALRLAYPVCLRLVGDECFAELARLYWRDHPPVQGDLNRYGALFSAFIGAGMLLDELPWLADVAQLEWAVHQASMAEDHEPISFNVLAPLTSEQLAGTTLKLQSALQIIPSPWPIVSIWQQHQPEHLGEMDFSSCTAETALVFRQGLEATVSRVNHGDAACLDALRAGGQIASALQAGLCATEDFVPALCLQTVFNHQFVIAFCAGDM